MGNFWNIVEIVVLSVPVNSSLTCAMLMVLTYRDSICFEERRIRFLLIFYYLFASLIWAGTILFNYQHTLFTYLNPLFYLSLLLASVILYHFIYYLTATDKESKFPLWHYLPPFIIFSVLFIWSLFIPYDVQHAIVCANDSILPEYRYYSTFYVSKHILRIVYLIIYLSLSFYRIRLYTRVSIERYGCMYKKNILWPWYLIGLSIVIIIVAIITPIASYSHIHKLLKNVFIVFLIAAGHIILVYNVIRRNYYLDCPDWKITDNAQTVQADKETDEGLSAPNSDAAPKRKMYTRHEKMPEEKNIPARYSLTKKQFDRYFKKHKPHMNPDFQMTDLIVPFEVNRTYISRFINKEYGMNFSRFLNRYRLHELDILLALPSNKGKDLRELVSKAGFGSFRSYRRAKQAEEGNRNKEKKK